MPKLLFLLFLVGLTIIRTVFPDNRYITAATLQYPPYEYSENDIPKGLAIDIIREIFKRTTPTREVKFYFYPWARAVIQVKTGKNDILFNAGKNKTRQQWGRYVNSTLILQQYALFTRKGSNISLTSDLLNTQQYSIGIRRGYLYGSGALRQALDKGKFKTIYKTDSVEQSVHMLLAGRTDFFVADIIPTLYYLRKQALIDKLEMIKTPNNKNLIVLEWPTYLLFSKKNFSKKFVANVEAILNNMKKDGTYSSIYQHYTTYN
ncbi:substrate-binding periplasmic protein [Spartinivicinus poritis]|uniref:Transporter substrate-binding domain-containing protein n=1 Tax=Spartinivicinus poritis TaxID=2994640 RepID=A0ABT5UBH3_9GAMM|nr:transporter substrate-binding domain-containing protein [Spartinivicinus sp. A2-2]MDE1463736.1 transporter substrate-binding domain-containing protein [Spartinivicinus sp. A2-2]